MGEDVTGDSIPQSDHVTRIIKNTDYDEDTGVSGSAFLLGGHGDGISANWVESLQLPRADALREILRVARTKRTVKPNQRFAIVNVGLAIQKILAERGAPLKAVHAPDVPPDPEDPSHSLVYVEPVEAHVASDELIAELIVSCIKQCLPVRDF